MTGLDKITSQIQEEAEASAKERLDAANKEAEQILADAQAACKVMEQEALEKAAAGWTCSFRSRAEAKNCTAADQAGNYRGGHWKSL